MKPNEPSVCRGLGATRRSLCLSRKQKHAKLDKLVPVPEEEEEEEEGRVVIRQQVLVEHLLRVTVTAEGSNHCSLVFFSSDFAGLLLLFGL